MFKIKRSLVPMLAMCVVANSMLAYSAWMGAKWAIVALAVFCLFITAFYGASSTLTDNALALTNETLVDLKTETDYTKALSDEHLDALRKLAEHDPATASILAERYRRLLRQHWPELDNVIPLRRSAEN